MKKSIMIIDDSRTSLQLMKSIIKEEFPNVLIHLYVSSLVAVQNLKRLKADLYIIDINMPHLNGFDILSSMHSLAAPVYFVSASSEVHLVEKAFSMGASEYFVKPFNVEKFKSKIKEALTTK
jgi:DNA-binding response OmpR family regulator